MFEQLTHEDRRTVFKGLKTLLESPLGCHEFYNGDKGHPAVSSIKGGGYAGKVQQATSENTGIYRMLAELSQDLKGAGDTGDAWWYDFSEWAAFCEFCRECHQKDVGATGADMST